MALESVRFSFRIPIGGVGIGREVRIQGTNYRVLSVEPDLPEGECVKVTVEGVRWPSNQSYEVIEFHRIYDV